MLASSSAIKIFGIRGAPWDGPRPGGGGRGDRGGCRQLDGDRGAVARAALDAQMPAVLLDDPVDDRHADAGAAVEERVEGVEEVRPLLLGHAAPGVDHLRGDRSLRRAGPTTRQRAALGHGAQSVPRQVPEDLGDLVGIGDQVAPSRARDRAPAMVVGDLVAVLRAARSSRPGDGRRRSGRSRARAAERSAGSP